MHAFNLIRTLRKPGLIAFTLLALAGLAAAQAYQQTNLVSDIQGLAPCQNPRLLNPWGLIASSTSPWWIADNNAGVSTLYTGVLTLDGAGNPVCNSSKGLILPLVINIPPIGSDPATGNAVGTGTPTGVVFTRGAGAGSTFQFKNAGGSTSTAIFTFVTEGGTISAWPGHGDAVLIIDNSVNPSAELGAVYKGATVAAMSPGGPSFLYVTNFRAGRIEVYDTNFQPVDLTGDGDRDRDDRPFFDREIPAGYAPFNVQEVNGNLYVTYARQNAAKHDDADFPGHGFVDKFSPAGKLLQRLEAGPWLNAPWGVALAPANFGFFSNHLLIGNAGSGQIAVYDADSGRFDGLLRDANGHALQNDRLWALRFGNGAAAGPTNWLYFTAGLQGEADGLFGFFTPADNSAPESNRDDH
ncbi:MAG TPA: TIGR03118 family protein [Terriglobales bacterium]|nr:TIGR03118 family protein [Terriglobales bacterium]